MKEKVINLEEVVKEKTGLEVKWHASDDVSKDTVVHRFGKDDEVHMLVDGCAGYEIIVNPELSKEDAKRKSFKGNFGE